MNESGWIKLNRKILNWDWYKDINTFKVFVHLILTANTEDHNFMGITIKRGELATSYQNLANEVGLTKKQILGTMKKLNRTQEVAQRSYPKFTIITVLRYDQYQNRAQSRAQEGHDVGHQEGTRRAREGQQYKNIRNKEYKKKEYSASLSDEQKLSPEEIQRRIAERRA